MGGDSTHKCLSGLRLLVPWRNMAAKYVQNVLGKMMK